MLRPDDYHYGAVEALAKRLFAEELPAESIEERMERFYADFEKSGISQFAYRQFLRGFPLAPEGGAGSFEPTAPCPPGPQPFDLIGRSSRI